ncbi:MAG: hypothetical protein ACI9R3_004163 [Verrucomicrobiales bacterium]|jgi:hypothetical protein
MATSLALGSTVPSDLYMQTSSPIIALIASVVLSLPLSAQSEEIRSTPLWEISIRSTVEWPPLEAPKLKASKEKEKDEAPEVPEMVTERSLQASMTGELRSIANGQVEFVPLLTAGTPSMLPLDSVVTLRKYRPRPRSDDQIEAAKKVHNEGKGGNNNARNSVSEDKNLRLVTFRSGSCVPGKLKRISPRGLILAFGDSEELTVPLHEIASITPLNSKGTKAKELPPAKGRHVARLTTGEVITGNIAPVDSERDRLTISSPILSGEFSLTLIETMLFPIVPRKEAVEPTNKVRKKSGRVAVVSFDGGATLTSPQISLSNGMLELEIWEGTPFRVALDTAESITFLDPSGMRRNGPIFLWGQYSDQADEFEKLKTALENEPLTRELIILDGNDGAGDDFTSALRRCTAFIWNEWENFDEAAFAEALSGVRGQPVSEQLQTYVSAGGIAIFMGISGGTADHFAQLGLGEIKSDGSIGDGTDLELIGIGDALASVTEGEIKASNSTMMYTAPEGGDWSPLLVQPGSPENAALVGRRIGSGWIFLMGMDFYETNDNITRILIELTQFSR